MRSSTIVMLLGFLVLVSGFLLAYWFDAFSVNALIVSIGLLLVVVVGTWWAQQAHNKDYNKKEVRKDFNYYWDVMNKALEKQRGDVLEWDSGIGNQSHVRTFMIGKELIEFQAFYAYLAHARQQVIVILNRKTEDIWRFYANPTPALLENPFYNFKPYENPVDILNRFGLSDKHRRSKNRGIRILMDNDDYDGLEPSEELASNISGE